MYTSEDSCSDMSSKADVPIDLTIEGTMVTSVKIDSTTHETTAEGHALFRTASKRWFFVAFANCAEKCVSSDGYHNCQGPLKVDYSFHLTNSNELGERRPRAGGFDTRKSLFF